jgi:hypothetical protein
MGGNRDLESP